MVSDPLAIVLRRFVLIQRLMCVGFIAAIPIYGAMALLIRRSGGLASASPVDSSILVALSTAAGIVALGSISYRRWLWSDAWLDRLARDSIDVPRLVTGQVDEEEARNIEALAPHERRFAALFARLQVPLAINLALNELVALIGLVAAFFANDVTVFVPFAIVAMALNVWMWPAPDRLYNRMEAKLLTLS